MAGEAKINGPHPDIPLGTGLEHSKDQMRASIESMRLKLDMAERGLDNDDPGNVGGGGPQLAAQAARLDVDWHAWWLTTSILKNNNESEV